MRRIAASSRRVSRSILDLMVKPSECRNAEEIAREERRAWRWSARMWLYRGYLRLRGW